MKISAHTLITNPHSSGYLIYLPAIQSFLDVADEVIVVDGGTTDESLEKLKTLRGQEKLIVYSSELTYWGEGDNWEWPQMAINRQVGFELCQGDWAIHFDADHILPEFEQEALLRELEHYQDKGVLFAFRVMGIANGKYKLASHTRKWCVNKRLALERQIPITYGLDYETGGLDNPIIPEGQSHFVDPVNGVRKPYYLGPQYPYPRSRILDVTIYRLGHFFFSSEQLRYKEQRLENAMARYQGRPSSKISTDQRPYKILDIDTFLRGDKHPKVLRDFVGNMSQRDIVGLRDYEYNWIRRLFGSYGRSRQLFQRLFERRILVLKSLKRLWS